MVRKILITPQGFEIFGNSLYDLFGYGYNVEFVGGQISSKDKLISKLKDVHGCIIGAEEIDKEVFDRCKNLKVLSRFGSGYNSISIDEAKYHDVAVTIVPDVGFKSVARHCLALLLTLTNNIIAQNNSIKDGKWLRTYNVSPENKRVGLIGLGPIGKEFARLCVSLGYNVSYYSRNKKEESKLEYVDSIDDLIYNSDIISLHINSNKETVGIINKDRIDLLKGKYFLNTARGNLVDEEYLYKKLLTKDIAGAGLDVYTNEPIVNIPEKVRQLDNVICTCHISSYDTKLVKHVGLQAINNIKNFFEGNNRKVNKFV